MVIGNAMSNDGDKQPSIQQVMQSIKELRRENEAIWWCSDLSRAKRVILQQEVQRGTQTIATSSWEGVRTIAVRSQGGMQAIDKGNQWVMLSSRKKALCLQEQLQKNNE